METIPNNNNNNGYSNNQATYSSLRTGIIRITPESMKCKLYCKGSACKYCTHICWSTKQQAIRGLYSSWVTSEILAMARPTQKTFNEFHFIKQLQENNIKAIFNLQRGGEHDLCGPSLLSTGFTYDPELLMRNKNKTLVYYYNFAIPDFGTTSSLGALMDVIKVIWFALKSGKIAIHCHAGLGRTGTLIACYLIWTTGISPMEAIRNVRNSRTNSIQSREQCEAVEQLAILLGKFATALPNTIIPSNDQSYLFNSITIKMNSFENSRRRRNSRGSFNYVQSIALNSLLLHQQAFLPNEEARKFSHVPKLLFLICNRLLRLIFEDDGVHYTLQKSKNANNSMANFIPKSALFSSSKHNVRTCTFGTLSVNWRNAFTHKGRAHVRYIVNLLARLSAFPDDKNIALTTQFQHVSLINLETILADLDASQLVFLLNACMESFRRPYCSKISLIRALEWFSPLWHEERQEQEKEIPKENSNSKIEILTKDIKSSSTFSSTTTTTITTTTTTQLKEVNLNASWHCMVFYACNVLSYLCGENYDVVVELITYWLIGDQNVEIKAAVLAHMRDLFARNMRQQEQQAAALRHQTIQAEIEAANNENHSMVFISSNFDNTTTNLDTESL